MVHKPAGSSVGGEGDSDSAFVMLQVDEEPVIVHDEAPEARWKAKAENI